MSGGPTAGCELCEAARFTHWYHEDDRCWVADCDACDCPMVVWSEHGTEPPDDVVEHCLARLADAADLRFGAGGWSVDRNMRQIPAHFHAHARDADWHRRRSTGRASRYTGVGAERRLR